MYYTIWVDIGHLWTPKHPLEQTVAMVELKARFIISSYN